MHIDFEKVAEDLLLKANTLLPQWLPAGKKRGHEYVVGSLRGDEGESLSINMRTGRWADFATDQKGGDLLSLYAAMHGLRQSDAARQLGYVNGAAVNGSVGHVAGIGRRAGAPANDDEDELRLPPDDAPAPPVVHPKHGKPSAVHEYRNADGRLIGYICRYDVKGGKTFAPLRWTARGWQRKAFPKPRPLYGLDLLAKRPNARVLMVEGEKAADALRPVLAAYCIMTWPGGANAHDTVDWSPLQGRAVDMWPDADDAGRNAMSKLAEILMRLGNTDLRMIDPEGRPKGWDAADAVAEGMTAKDIVAWIKRDGGVYLKSVRMTHAVGAAVTPQPPASHLAKASAPSPTATSDIPPMERLLATPPSQRWGLIGIPAELITNGRPPANADTVDRFCSFFAGVFWYDTFLMRPMTTWQGKDAHPVDEETVYSMLVFFQRELLIPKMSKETVNDGITAYCLRHKRNIAQEWMLSLKWDGKERLPILMPAAFGTMDDDYHRAVGRCFFVGMVMRVLRPGCQMDNVLVLEGGEGNFKSSALRIIGGDWFDEASSRIGDKDFYQCLTGKMLVELSEMASLDRVSVEKIKAEITKTKDTYRKTYGILPGDYPRQNVFTCTTNRDDWNRSDTGARRFWRVKTGIIDLQWLRDNREQLFAEAVHRAQAGESYWDVPRKDQDALSFDARPYHTWEQPVITYADSREFVRVEDIFRDALGIDIANQRREYIEDVQRILRIYGYRSTTTKMHGRSVRIWRKTGAKPVTTEGPPPPPQPLTDSFDDDRELE